MTRNTKEVALIQIRSGKLGEMPKALHQSEFGLAKDANRLFIGNAANPALKNREVFPYQNLELLTEYSELKDYFKYSYENNITSIPGDSNVTRLELKEFLPIVVSCQSTSEESITIPAGVLKINDVEIVIDHQITDMYEFIEIVNSYASGTPTRNPTNTYATIFPGDRVITFICLANNLKLEGDEIKDAIGYPNNVGYDVSMPIRKVTEKLDDNLHISDFAIKGDGENVSKQIFDALVEVYKNYNDPQFFRDVFFPAGDYEYNMVNDSENAPYFTPFPLISNLHVHGEGIDRTILNNETTNSLLCCIDDNFNAEYGNSGYGSGKLPSNILIEDVTFSGKSLELARLIGCSNVTFNRVKFIGNGNNKLFEIRGLNPHENDIDLELNDGTLTLKAGSKLYIPNGFEQDGTTPHFDEVVIENDVTRIENTAHQYYTMYYPDNNLIYISNTSPEVSFYGPTQPTISGQFAYWYDSANNVIKRTDDSGATWTSGYSLPFGIITVSGGSISSIDQVFEGTGYFSNKEFVLPGIEFANNITFNDCIFEKANCAIDIQDYAKNIEVNNCKFIDISAPTIKIGNDDEQNNVKAITVSGCQFENTIGTSGAVISLGVNSKYTSVTNCNFDNAVIEKQTNSPVPYIDNAVGEEYTGSSYNAGAVCIYEHKFYKAKNTTTAGEFNPSEWTEYQRYNYTDILDITTDDKKLLRFKFTQPRWEYINYLINSNGQVVLTVDGKDTDITSANGLNIIEDNNGLEIKSVKDGDVTLSMGGKSDLELGKSTTDLEWRPDTSYNVDDEVVVNGIIYKCLIQHTSESTFEEDLEVSGITQWSELTRTQIIIDKILQLNDHMISNTDGDEDIIIEPATDKVIEIQQTPESTTNYEDKIVDKPNAVPNVAFVKGYTTSSIIKHISFDDIEDIDANGNLLIGEFPIEQFGENIHITGITINIRNPFYKVIPYLNSSSAMYMYSPTSNITYYSGDVVRKTVASETKYAVILKTHASTENTSFPDDYNDNMRIIPSTYVKDIKYVNVLGSDGQGVNYNLTLTYNNSYSSYNGDTDMIDIQKNNLFGYVDAYAFSTSRPYGTTKEIVKYQDRNYLINFNEQTQPDTLTPEGLHDNIRCFRMYDEGYIYKFDADRNYNVGLINNENPYTINYAGGKIFIQLYDEDKVLVTSDNNTTKLLNPGGDMIVRVDFVKEEL